MRKYTIAFLVATFTIAACSRSPVTMGGGSGGEGGEGGGLVTSSASSGAGGSCAGCLTPDFRCLPGDSAEACGIDGASCASCGRANGTAACVMGACVEPIACDGFFLDCDSDATNGCETPMTDTHNCGSCGFDCGAGGFCRESCSPGQGCTFTCIPSAQ